MTIEGLDHAVLTGPVCRALGRPGAEIVDWQPRPIAYRHLNPISGGLYRLTGTAQDNGETIPWSLVLKITQPLPEAVVSAGVKQLSLSPAEVETMLDAFRWEREASTYRSGLLDALDRLPHTLCHLDAWRPNLLSVGTPNGDSETVALDWAFVGTGAIGEEVGQLVAADLLFAGADASRPAEFGEMVLASFVEGLRDAGWRGDARLVRLGYSASAALRWGVRATGLQTWSGNPAMGSTEDAATALQRRAAMTYYLLDLTDEARSLITALD